MFGWAPHPWGWAGFDHYDDLANALASGRPFPTMKVPWGYAYFLAAFYRLFGSRPWVPLVVQVALNATTPLLVFAAARQWTDRGTAAWAALLTGIFSFNTIYASTQSSDAVCTVLFLTALVAFLTALRRDRGSWFALTGLLAGLASQFRPNLILIPVVLAAYAVWSAPLGRRVRHAALLVACAAATLTPWVVRNYRLTRTVLPTSVHGGAQLWYGSLQVGPYLNSRGYNPQSVFESPVFDYTSLDEVPLIVTGGVGPCASELGASLSLVYWTDRDTERRRLSPSARDRGQFRFEMPPPLGEAVYYYYLDVHWPDEGVPPQTTPALGDAGPFVYFVSRRHLEDLDIRGDLLDAFDLVRLVRHDAWGEPLPFFGKLEAAGVETTPRAVEALLLAFGESAADLPRVRIDRGDREARLTLGEGSSVVVPRAWGGRITEVAFNGPLAEALMHAHASLAALAYPAIALARADRCAESEDIAVNQVFYRQEPQAMRRYFALAIDNIRRAPAAFALASLYRAYRVFVVYGTADFWTAQQFRSSAVVYGAATVASATYLALFLAGVVIAWKEGAAIGLPLALILYVPATIAPMLTNMRYSVTVQGLMFIFVATALRKLLLSARRGRVGS